MYNAMIILYVYIIYIYVTNIIYSIILRAVTHIVLYKIIITYNFSISKIFRDHSRSMARLIMVTINILFEIFYIFFHITGILCILG